MPNPWKSEVCVLVLNKSLEKLACQVLEKLIKVRVQVHEDFDVDVKKDENS